MSLTSLTFTQESTNAILLTDECFLCGLLQKLPNTLPLSPNLPYVSLDQFQLLSGIRNWHITPFYKVRFHFEFNGSLENNISLQDLIILD